MAKTSILVGIIATLFGLLVGESAAVAVFISGHTETEEETSTIPVREDKPDTLSSWQVIQMAIIYTESRFNPDAVGAARDLGLMQITPIYVSEVNRVAGTGYVPEDAFDMNKSLAMFDLMQAHYNPEHDIEKAIYYHNKAAFYRQAVMKSVEFVHNYEAARAAVPK